MIVGGNIDGVTRVMTTAIALETSKGDLPLAMALGIVLHRVVGASRLHRPRAARPTACANGARAAMASAEPMLAARDLVGALRRGAGARRPLARRPRGDFARVILGANGAGKSVLLRALHGLLRPESGRHRLGRRSTPAAPGDGLPAPRDAAPLGPREPRIRARGWPACRAPNAAARAVEALAKVGLEALADRPARVLSGGEQQRLALARAWALPPQVLFLDEPTASLDPGAAKREVERCSPASPPTARRLVMTTHNLGQAKRLASRVVYLDRGRVGRRPAAARSSFNGGCRRRTRTLSSKENWHGPLNDESSCRFAAACMAAACCRLAMLAAAAGAVAQDKFIVMASTTSTEQSGLFGTCCRSSRRPPASTSRSWRWAPARRWTWAAAATPTCCSCTTRWPRRSSSPKASACAPGRHVQRLRAHRPEGRPRRRTGQGHRRRR
jgi:energy-coupling factor transporter ATP-binding protein EcfA2